ncbi:hypothetical protein [Hominifimenecus sp. rT4P-3]|uniref:hypothetical protein n=1 Tax=Hominifimenecus sp. rT4P-3 TaxID=3242979 RepID=UPI003DA687E7
MAGSKRRWLVLWVGFCLLACPIFVKGKAEEESLWMDVVECMDASEAEQYVFPEKREKDGIWYRLLRTEVLESAGEPVIETEIRTETRSSGALLPGETWEPEPMLEQDGVAYHLQETREEKIPIRGRTQKAEGWIDYFDRVEKPTFPPYAEFEIEDAALGTSKTVTLALTETTEEQHWKEDFQAILTAEPADASAFVLGEQVVTLGEDELGLAGQEEAVLHVLGLDPAYYRIRHMSWSSPSYDQNGVLRREIQVSGARFVTDYHGYYSGVGELDDVWGTVLTAVYQAEIETQTGIETIYTVLGYYQPEGEVSEVLPLLGAGTSAGIFLAAIFLWREKRKKEA